MSFDPALMESVVPAAALGMATMLIMATTLRWWRGRLAADETQGMRARIASAAPDPHVPMSPGQPPRRANTFVGRDHTAIPLE